MTGIAVMCDRKGRVKRRKCHLLKCWPEFFAALAAGTKTFEVRSGLFEAGEILLLDEFDPATETYSGQSLVFEITFVMQLAESTEGLCLPFPPSNEPVWCLSLKRV